MGQSTSWLEASTSLAEIGSEWSLGDAEQYTKWQGSVKKESNKVVLCVTGSLPPGHDTRWSSQVPPSPTIFIGLHSDSLCV